MAPFRRALLVLGTLACSLSLSFVRAVTETNVTVDDQTSSNSGVIVYTPPTMWNQGAGCDFCSAQANASLAFDGTWHDASYNPQRDQTAEISISFTGTAIYTFFIVPDLNSPATTNLNFTLDGEAAGSFHHPLSNVSEFLYNVSTFGRSGLENAAHTLIITSGGDTSSLLLFDYLVYTTEKHDGVPIGEIVGPAVGGAAALAILAATVFFCCRKRRTTRRISMRSTAPSEMMAERFEPDPYMIRGGDVERGPEKAGIRRTVAVPELLDGSDYTTTSETDTQSPESNVPRIGDSYALGDSISPLSPRPPPTLSSTANVDALPQYESITRAGQ